MRKKHELLIIFLLLTFIIYPGRAAAQFLSFAESEKREWRVDEEERVKRAAAGIKSRTEFNGDKKTRYEKFDGYGNKIFSESFENYNGIENIERVTYKYNGNSSVEAEIRETLSKEPDGKNFIYRDAVEYLYGADNTLLEVRKTSESKVHGGKSSYRYSTRYEYDANKNIVSVTKYVFDESDGQEKVENRYTYAYDEFGYCVSQSWAHKDGAGFTKEVETFENQYYPVAIVTAAVSGNNPGQKGREKPKIRSRFISKPGIRECSITVSENGRYLEQVFYKPDGSLKKRTLFNYDGDENLIEEVDYGSNGDLDGRCVYKYDEKKRASEEINFNAAGKVLTRTVYSYGAQGDKTKAAISYSSDGRESKKAVWRFNKFGYTIDFSRYDAFEKKKNIIRFEYTYF